MVADWFATMVDQPQFDVRVVNVRGARFEITAADTRPMISLLLRRQRQKSGLAPRCGESPSAKLNILEVVSRTPPPRGLCTVAVR